MNENKLTALEKAARAKELTEIWGQQHLLGFAEELPGNQKEQLIEDILQCDFTLIHQLFEKIKTTPEPAEDVPLIPMAVLDKAALTKQEWEELTALGLDAMRQGQYAVVTMAGGQGTRLGYSGPKGTYTVKVDDQEISLFELQLESIKARSEECCKPIHWYIMTSNDNHEATADFFERNGYFGYPEITLFQQGTLPMLDMDGKILLEEKYSIKKGSDGNGSIFRAMRKSTVADDLSRRGIQWFFVCNVDNILAPCADPLFLGFTIKNGSLCATKSIIKRSPDEKVGVFCHRDARPAVVEYTELPHELAELINPAGELVYADAYISCSIFRTDIIGLPGVQRMPYHTAVKKTPYISSHGAKVEPDRPNAYKFEAFIFDAFQSLERVDVLRVQREEEFAPIKNTEGEDSPATAVKSYRKFWGI